MHEVRTDLARGEPVRLQRQRDLLDPVRLPPTFLHGLRIKRPLTAPRRVDRDYPGRFGRHLLGSGRAALHAFPDPRSGSERFSSCPRCSVSSYPERSRACSSEQPKNPVRPRQSQTLLPCQPGLARVPKRPPRTCQHPAASSNSQLPMSSSRNLSRPTHERQARPEAPSSAQACSGLPLEIVAVPTTST